MLLDALMAAACHKGTKIKANRSYFRVKTPSEVLSPAVTCLPGGAGDREQRGAQLPELADGVPGGRVRCVPELGQ